MKTWKKNLVAAAVLITVCGGIYVNWLYTEENSAANLTDTLDADKVLSSDTLVMAQDGEGDIHDMTTMTDYFAAVRLSRQEARDNAVTMLQEAMAYSEDGESVEANAQLEDIVDTALCEAQIESLVIAKGYADCVAYIGDDGISVAVATPEEGLQKEDVAVISDIVVNQSNYDMTQIHVIEVQ